MPIIEKAFTSSEEGGTTTSNIDTVPMTVVHTQQHLYRRNKIVPVHKIKPYNRQQVTNRGDRNHLLPEDDDDELTQPLPDDGEENNHIKENNHIELITLE
ncbi:hypothetical protein CHUAL_009673 [Chamberlinius hualienensis]